MAAVGAYCGVCKNFSYYLSNNGSKIRTENFEYRVRTTVVFRVAQLTSSEFAIHHCYQGVASVLRLFEKQRPKTRKAVKTSLDVLCDVQLVTGTAIMIAGIVQVDSLTFYHQQFVLSYWYLTLNSFWVARSGGMQNAKDDHDDNNEWHYWTRQVFIFITSVLSIYYQLVITPRQKDEWNNQANGFCFISNDKSDYEQNFLWITGLIIFAVYILLLLLAGLTARLTGCEDWMEIASKWTGDHQRTYHERYKTWMSLKLQITKDSEGSEFQSHPAPNITSTSGSAYAQPSTTLAPTPNRHIYWQYAARAILTIPLIVEWAFLRFFALWAWGDENSITIILAIIGFAAWSTFDLIDFKLSNANLATNESDWGFGQILPIVLLGLILLQILDAIQGEGFPLQLS